jgi:hypothetical protein
MQIAVLMVRGEIGSFGFADIGQCIPTARHKIAVVETTASAHAEGHPIRKACARQGQVAIRLIAGTRI